jgi:putative SOS response-associated peptidase YedK
MRGKLPGVCTYHKAQIKKAARHGKVGDGVWRKLVAAFDDLNETGIEPTMPVAVITGEREVVTMSWGFRRRYKRKDGKGLTAPKAVVNAKSERMEEFMWRDAYHHRRCLVPVTEFYEWTGPAKAKVAHRFHRGGECFFVAGLWEEDPEFGLCHTMLTTEPNREVAATGHDRCLVALLDDELDPWLDGQEFELARFRRPDGMFQVESGVPNPRDRGGDSGPRQGELF